MIRATLTAAALALLPVAAQAADKPADLGHSWMTYNRASDRFCLVPKQAATGSRIASPDCRTRSEWAREGVSVQLR